MRVPFDRYGNLMHYPHPEYIPDPVAGGQRQRVDPDWREIDKPFKATLALSERCRGRSAAYFIWTRVDTGQAEAYPMFMTDLQDLLTRHFHLCYGVAHGTWTVKKRGQNYGVALAEPMER